MDHLVQFRSFSAGINMPNALSGQHLHGLPPYAPVNAYKVSDFPDAPAEWSRGDESTATFFVAVEENRGMWIDLTANQRAVNHVAAIVSIQGVNALTARQVDQRPILEQYRTACPVHGQAFIGNRHCRECGFDWPAQNYLSSATGRIMWIDGFRTRGSNGNPEAETRQFFFTSDTTRGIAAQVIGEARTYSVKIHFFNGPAKPVPAVSWRGSGPVVLRAAAASASPPTPRRMEIGAGARIQQDIGVDRLMVDQYAAEVTSIEFYYVDRTTADAILNGRHRSDGALSGHRVGFPAGGTSPHKTF